MSASPDMVTSLLNLGLPGIVIIGLAWAYLQEKKRNEALQAKLDVIHEKRLEEAIRAVEGSEKTTSVLAGMTEILRTLQQQPRRAAR